ncbi:hypothetical protein J4Q44_G00315320 [Coregonus suidteri]|uniref:Uncharacterized protein n=1 Tax=Coregonus suidteri TaxID=861788 RepID=A0AAN8QQX9_9TELE
MIVDFRKQQRVHPPIHIDGTAVEKEENAVLAQRVQAGREGIAQTDQHIATAVDEWKASVREFQTLSSSICPPASFDDP